MVDNFWQPQRPRGGSAPGIGGIPRRRFKQTSMPTTTRPNTLVAPRGGPGVLHAHHTCAEAPPTKYSPGVGMSNKQQSTPGGVTVTGWPSCGSCCAGTSAGALQWTRQPDANLRPTDAREVTRAHIPCVPRTHLHMHTLQPRQACMQKRAVIHAHSHMQAYITATQTWSKQA